MADPWQNVRAGDPNGFRTAGHLARQAQRNQALRGSAAAAAGLIDSCGPPYWDRASWERYRETTGSYPFSASELPTSFEDCPVWAYELMGLRPPMMAR
jgi:hypothetical protein